MKPFVARLNHKFVEQDFIDHSVWATYYEPDEIDSLVELGFDLTEVANVLLKSRGNDEYSFPLPAEAAASPFQYLYLGARLTTKGGTELVGYSIGPCLGVFHAGEHYCFNRALPEQSVGAAIALATAVGEEEVFPMQIYVVATGEIRTALA